MRYFITSDLIKELDGDSLMRTELALALEITERAVYNTVRRCMKDPIPNCSLTKLAAIRFFEGKGYTEPQIITEQKPAV